MIDAHPRLDEWIRRPCIVKMIQPIAWTHLRAVSVIDRPDRRRCRDGKEAHQVVGAAPGDIGRKARGDVGRRPWDLCQSNGRCSVRLPTGLLATQCIPERKVAQDFGGDGTLICEEPMARRVKLEYSIVIGRVVFATGGQRIAHQRLIR